MQIETRARARKRATPNEKDLREYSTVSENSVTGDCSVCSCCMCKPCACKPNAPLASTSTTSPGIKKKDSTSRPQNGSMNRTFYNSARKHNQSGPSKDTVKFVVKRSQRLIDRASSSSNLDLNDTESNVETLTPSDCIALSQHVKVTRHTGSHTTGKQCCPCGDTNELGAKWIECSLCDQWYHTECLAIKTEALETLARPDTTYTCPQCLIHNILRATHPKIRFLVKSSIKTGKLSPNTAESSKPEVFTEAAEAAVVSDLESIERHTVNKEQETVQPEDPQQRTDYQNSHIVILDNISDPVKYKTRKQILKEINRVKPSLNVKHAYPLAGGGICLHLNSNEDKVNALFDWLNLPFGSTNIQPHEPADRLPNTKLFIKKVPLNIDNTAVASALHCVATVNRLKVCGTTLPSNTIAISINKSEAAKLISGGVCIAGKIYKCTPKRKCKIIRCYKCQQFGHIAKTCVNTSACAFCAQNHDSGACVSTAYMCVNCGGGHSAHSNQCPVFKRTELSLQTRLI